MKKFFRMLSTTAFLLCLLSVGVHGADPATSGNNAPIDFSTDSHICPICGGSAVTWKPLPEISTKTVLAAGHYYVPEGGLSNTSTYTFNSNETRCIHLNGSSITSTAQVFNNTNNSRLNIFGSGTVSGSNELGAVFGVYTGRVYLYGGSYSGTGIPVYLNKATYARIYLFSGATITGGDNGSVYIKDGRFEMYGGTITGGSAETGGNIKIDAGRLYLDGGTVTGGTATNGGNVYVSGATTFRIKGATITKGTATGNGGNVYIAGATDGTYEMSKGTVSSGSAKNGGGFYLTGAELALSGGTLTGNKATDGGSFYLASKGILSITGGTVTKGTSTDTGGNIYAASTSSVLNLSGGTVSAGTAKANGGNIYFNNGNLNVTGGTVSGGKAVEGGNIYTRTGRTSNSNTATIGGAGTPLITGGTASSNGGNLFVEGRATLDSCAFEDGTVTGKTYGQDLYLDKTAMLTVSSDYTGTCQAHIHSMFIHQAKLNGNVLDTTLVSCDGAIRGKLILGYYKNAPIFHSNADGSVSLYQSALVHKDGGYSWYNDNAAMLEAYDDSVAYIRAAAGEMPLSGGDYTVDLIGKTVHFTGSGSVTCFDSENDDFIGFGAATFDGVQLANAPFTTVSGKTYYALQEGESYSFHRLESRISGVSLRPSADGIYYTGIWNCDEKLSERIDSYGVAVSITAMPTAFTDDVLYTAFDGETFQSGTEKTGVLIRGILQFGSADNDIHGKMPIFAVPYVTVDGNMSMGSGMGKSLYDVLSIFDQNMGIYNPYAESLQGFMTKWEDLSWDFTFAYNADAAHLESLYAGRTPFHGELHDHADTGGTSDGNLTLAQWTANLKKLDMDFAAIVDHKQLLHMDLADWDDTMFIGGTEASTRITDSKATGNQLHYNMIFTDRAAAEEMLKTFPEFKFAEDENGEWHFAYPNFTTARFRELIQAVKDAGGMFVFVHPKDGKRFISDDPLDYWFADETGLEVFYVTKTDTRTLNNYKLWTDLLAAGKRVWATAGYDGHAVASNTTLTTIYAEQRLAESYFSHAKTGDMSIGGIGIRMVIGDTLMGGSTDFAGKRLTFCVSDFHSSQLDPTHTYRAKLLSDTGVVYEQIIDPYTPFYYAMDADSAAAFYRVEVYDETTGVLTGIGNPIWNNN